MKNDYKLCICILAHKNVPQVARLCKALYHPQVKVLVHFDAKMNEPILDELLKQNNPNIEIAPFRNSNYLDTWSLVDTTIKMAKYATRDNSLRRGHLALISGQDYPIKPINSLVSFLEKSNGASYIDCTAPTQGSWHNHKLKQSQLFTNAHRYILKFKPSIIRRIILKGIRIGDNMIIPQKYKIKNLLTKSHIDFYGGSAWWVMSTELMSEIIREYETNTTLNILKDVITPEESFFQTMAKRTNLAKSMSQFAPSENQDCMQFAFFSGPNKPFTGHPYIIKAEDFEMLKTKPQYFARKFDMNIDSKIFDIIDKELLQ